MSKITISAELTIDKEVAQDMLICAGYGSEERNDDKIIADVLSILDNYGVTSKVVNKKTEE